MEDNQIDVSKVNKDIAQDTNKKSRYIKLKNQLVNICNDLRESKAYIDEAKEQLAKNYTVDSETADQGKLINVSNQINDTLNQIQNRIIPAVNSEISSINNSIASLKEMLGGVEE